MVELVSTKREDMKMVTFADDFSAVGKLKSLLQWWTTLLEERPNFGYFHEPANSWLITKPETHAIYWKRTFQRYQSKDNKFRQKVPRVCYIGTFTLKKQQVDEIMPQRISEIEVLSQIANVEYKVTYLMRTSPNMNEELGWLDDAINNKLIPSFTENKLCGNDELLLLSIPTKLGRMGIPVFSEIAKIEFQNSSLLTKGHVSLIARQHQEENQIG